MTLDEDISECNARLDEYTNKAIQYKTLADLYSTKAAAEMIALGELTSLNDALTYLNKSDSDLDSIIQPIPDTTVTIPSVPTHYDVDGRVWIRGEPEEPITPRSLGWPHSGDSVMFTTASKVYDYHATQEALKDAVRL